jgi:hypothetical protein
MVQIAHIQGLLERVRAATGPDAALDAEIALAFGAAVEPAERNALGDIRVPAWWTMPGASREEWPHRKTPWPLTASLDAALALVERVLPGWRKSISELQADEWEGSIWDRGCVTERYGLARTAPLALLAALLVVLGGDASRPEPLVGEETPSANNPEHTGKEG